VALLSSGCADQLAGRAIDGSLDELSRPESTERISGLLTEPELQQAGSELTAAILSGVLHELAKPEHAKALGENAGQVLRDELSPAIAAALAESVDAVLSEALSAEHRARFEVAAAQISGAAVTAVMKSFAKGLEHEVGPAAARTYEKDLGPALLAQLDKPEFQQPLGQMAHTLSYQTVRGSTQAVTDLQNEADGDSFLKVLGTRITIGWAALVAFAVGLAIALIVMAMMLRKHTTQRRQLEVDARQRERTMTFLMHTVLMKDVPAEERAELMRRFGLDDADESEPSGRLANA
jgi:hypothetical protein